MIPVNTYISNYDSSFKGDFNLQEYSGEAIVIPKAAGEATITVSYGGKTDTCIVCVSVSSSDTSKDDNKDKMSDPSDSSNSNEGNAYKRWTNKSKL